MSVDILTHNVDQEPLDVQPGATGSGASIDDIVGINWLFDSNDLGSDFNGISLNFDFNQENGIYALSGYSGVNYYFTGCVDNGNDHLEIGDFLSTRMGGDPEDMAKEYAYMEYMRNFSGQNDDGTPIQVTMEQQGDRLIFHGLNGHEIVFTRD